MKPRHQPSLTLERMKLYESLGFDVLHDHRVNINPMGERIEVDFSATDPEFIVQVAIKQAFEAGQRAGETALQNKLRGLLGAAKGDNDD